MAPLLLLMCKLQLPRYQITPELYYNYLSALSNPESGVNKPFLVRLLGTILEE
jgi:hypothetical protein